MRACQSTRNVYASGTQREKTRQNLLMEKHERTAAVGWKKRPPRWNEMGRLDGSSASHPSIHLAARPCVGRSAGGVRDKRFVVRVEGIDWAAARQKSSSSERLTHPAAATAPTRFRTTKAGSYLPINPLWSSQVADARPALR
jgi:hypothetical protein